MSRTPPQKQPVILAIAPSTRGVGVAVLEGNEKLVYWGVKLITGDKNTRSLAKMEKMIAQFQPDVLVIENYSAKNSRRAPRIRELGQQIRGAVAKHHVRVFAFSREQVKNALLADGNGTKQDIAEIVAKRFPEELGFRLPPKRRPWNSEDPRMSIFDAVALALAFGLKTKANPGR